MINSICRRSAVVTLTLCALALAACGPPGQRSGTSPEYYAFGPSPARGTAKDCDAASASPKQHIDGCTSIIDRGRLQGKDLAIPYNNRGIAYNELGEYRRAIEDLDQALRLNPGNAKVYYDRGISYINLGEHRRAIEDNDQALRLDPGYALAYNNRGISYTTLGEHRRAIEDYDQALRIDPGSAMAYRNRGIAYKNLGDFERAAGDWDQSIRVGGASWAKWWQEKMKGKGHYAGAIDGVFVPDMRPALLACAVDPGCMN